MQDCSTLNKRKMKRRVVRVIKELNRLIYNDDLWQGRFVCRMKRIVMKAYSDHSGLDTHCLCEFLDKKTGKNQVCWYDSFEIFHGKLSWIMNDFIVKTVDVWNEKPSPRDHEYRKLNNYRKEVR